MPDTHIQIPHPQQHTSWRGFGISVGILGGLAGLVLSLSQMLGWFGTTVSERAIERHQVRAIQEHIGRIEQHLRLVDERLDRVEDLSSQTLVLKSEVNTLMRQRVEDHAVIIRELDLIQREIVGARQDLRKVR